MASHPTQTAQSLFWQAAINADVQPDPSITSPEGVVGGLSTQFLSALVQTLNEAILWSWIPDTERPEVPWPVTVLSDSITPAAGLITYAQLGNADSFWRIWSANPSVYNASPTAIPIRSRADANGIYPQTALTPLWVFYRPFRPIFTYNVSVSGQLYPSGTYVYDSQFEVVGTTTMGSGTVACTNTTGIQVGQIVTGPGIAANSKVSAITPNVAFGVTVGALSTGTGTLNVGSGNVYVSIVDSANAAQLYDVAQWSPQLVPDALVQMILWYAEGCRQRNHGNDPSYWFGEASRVREEKKASMLPKQGQSPPWDWESSIAP